MSDSGYGLYSNTVNLYRAFQGSSVYLPSGGFSFVAETVAPGNQTAQDIANIGTLSLALVSGRVPVGSVVVNGDSALATVVPTGINGMLDAKAVAPTGLFKNVLIPTADPSTSVASNVLNVTQSFQLFSTAYDYFQRYFPPSQTTKK